MLCSNRCKTKETHNRGAEGGYILILLLIVLVFLIVGGVAILVTYGIAVFAPVVIGWIFIGIIASFVRSSPDGKGISTIILVLGGLVTIAYFVGNGWKHALICGHNVMVGSVSNDHNTQAMVCGDKTYFNVPNGMSCEEYANSAAAAKAADEPTPEIKQEVARRREKGLYGDDYRGYKYCDNYNIMYLLSAAKQMRRAGDYKSALPSFEQAKNCTQHDRFRDWIEGYILECKIKLGMDKIGADRGGADKKTLRGPWGFSVEDIYRKTWIDCDPDEDMVFFTKGKQIRASGDCTTASIFFYEALACTHRQDHRKLIDEEITECMEAMRMMDAPIQPINLGAYYDISSIVVELIHQGRRAMLRGNCSLSRDYFQQAKEYIIFTKSKKFPEILEYCDKAIQECEYIQPIS